MTDHPETGDPVRDALVLAERGTAAALDAVELVRRTVVQEGGIDLTPEQMANVLNDARSIANEALAAIRSALAQPAPKAPEPEEGKRDMSIIEQARAELKLVNFGEEDSAKMVAILEAFFGQWDSGGAVYVASDVLRRLIAGKPLAPLSGADDEWNEVGDGIWQNRRCGTVFRDKDGRAYNIDEPGRPTITFPYWPEKADVGSPLVEIDT